MRYLAWRSESVSNKSAGALDKLEAFASLRGPDFYRLPRSAQKVTLERVEQQVPTDLPFGDERLVPMRAGESTRWRLVD